MFPRDLLSLMEIYFLVDIKYKYRYQQSLSYKSINDQTPTTQFNNPIFQCTIARHTIMATLSHSRIESSNKYNHSDYKSLTQENIQSFMAISHQAELIINCVILNTILKKTMLQHTMIKVFDTKYIMHIQ